MKKILSLLLLALIGVNIASAQMTATCKGKEVQDGDEIVFYAHEQIDDFTGTSAITCGHILLKLVISYSVVLNSLKRFQSP